MLPKTNAEEELVNDNDNVPMDYAHPATAKELADCAEIVKALTDQEQQELVDEQMPLRHLRAEKGNIGAAITKIKNTIEWRREFKVLDIISCIPEDNEQAKIIRLENETGKIYVRGYDLHNRAVMYMRPGNENTTNTEHNMQHLVFMLEKAIACTKQKSNNTQSKICLMIDYTGFKLRNAPPLSTSRRVLDILQNHYPERLHRAYICNPPWTFRTFWTIIKPFIDPITKQKVVFATSPEAMEQIKNDMGPENSKKLEACAGNTEPVRDFDSTEHLNLPFEVAFDE